MKLMHIRIKDFRSFSGEHDFDVSSGVNYFVGPNNCGKSNLVRGLELALDPDTMYAPQKDRPARPGAMGAPPTTRITLTFQVGKTSPEVTLLKRAKEYELAVRKARKGSTTGKIQTYAADREVRMVTSFVGQGGRQTTFQAKGYGAASLPADSREHLKLEAQFRSVVRSAVVHSGEDLESLLKGKFRQILQLVIADHLGDELEKAEEARSQYLAALQAELLEPLRAQIQDRVGAMFPEIAAAKLVPDLPTVAETLSSVDVHLGDLVTTQLIDKGTGVRGAVLVSMLQYLAEQSRRSLVLAVEEPEAFLHPAAQEAIMGQLEDLATRADVSLLVTTHSPYVLSRRADALITQLRKRADGVTSKAASCAGDQSRVELIGGLYRDAGMAGVLERALSIPASTRAVVITEGYTDGEFLRIACDAAGRPELLEAIHFIQAGGAKKVVFQAILARSATDRPVVAVLDHDDQGRAAISKLEDFGWSKNKELLSLAAWPEKCGKGHDVEVEDLIPSSLWDDVIKRVGELDAIDSKQKCDGKWHYQVSTTGKVEALAILPSSMKSGHAKPLVWLAEEINARIDKIEKANAAAKARTKASAAS
jgi:putative ATP-dependent endonuclease of the OLD family